MRINETRAVAKMLENGGSGGGTEVVANPELAGDEAALTGLEVAGTKYKVEGGGVPSMLELDVDFSGAFPVEATVEDEEDIAKLEAIKTAFLTDGTFPPTYYKIEETEEGYRSNSLYSLMEVNVDTLDTKSVYMLYGRTVVESDNVFMEYLKIEKTDDTWTATLGDSISGQ